MTLTRVLLYSILFTATAHAQVQSTVVIDPGRHPLGDALTAIVTMPAAMGAEPVPACAILHGSGGLLRENAPGAACGPQIESNFSNLAAHLADLGVASIMPSSFASRDARFCEDNDPDYFQFAGPPFFQSADGPIERDGFYKMRRLVIRVMDLLAAMDHMCAQPEVDCQRLCVIGASNGGSTLMSYVANGLARHLTEFVDTSTRRELETQSDFEDRQIAFAHFPQLPAEMATLLQERPVPRFAQAISPGCRLRELVPTVDPGDAEFDPEVHLTDLYYPFDPVHLEVEIGSTDDVPDACRESGIRNIQARAFEDLTTPAQSRFNVEIYPGAGHNLLGEVGESMHAKIETLVSTHFFPAIFRDGFETLNGEK